MKGIAPIRVIPLLLLAACGALCQEPSSAVLSQKAPAVSPNPPEAQRPEDRSWQSLPDAPSPVPPSAEQPGIGTLYVEPGNLAPPPQHSFTAFDSLQFATTEARDPFAHHLDFQIPRPDQVYTPSTSTSFLGRTSYAVSKGFLSHSPSGKLRLNTSYCLGILALAAVDTAYRPYWDRTGPAVVGNFGVSIGSDAGINVFHEFEPAIREKARSMTPKFVFRLQERFTHDSAPRDSLSFPGR